MQRPSYDFSRIGIPNSTPVYQPMSANDDTFTGEACHSSTRSSLIPQRMVNESGLAPRVARYLPYPSCSSGPSRVANTSYDARPGASWFRSPQSSYSYVPQSLMNARDLAPPSSFRPPRTVNASDRFPSGSFGLQRMINTSSYAPRYSAPGFAAPRHSVPGLSAPGFAAPRHSVPGLSAPRPAALRRAGYQEMGNEGSLPPRYKTKLCARWITRSCWLGDNCTYAHGYSELRFQGMGNEGPPPPRYKTKLCIYWSTKRCRWSAEQCLFAHGVSDLRN